MPRKSGELFLPDLHVNYFLSIFANLTAGPRVVSEQVNQYEGLFRYEQVFLPSLLKQTVISFSQPSGYVSFVLCTNPEILPLEIETERERQRQIERFRDRDSYTETETETETNREI